MMVITELRRTSLVKRINERLLYVDNAVIVSAYHSVLSVLEQGIDTGEEYALCLANMLPPERLFDTNIAMSEGFVFYAIIRDILRYAGIKSPIKRGKTDPEHAAELLYVSSNQENLSDTEKEAEKQTMKKAMGLLKNLSIPITPLNHRQNSKQGSLESIGSARQKVQLDSQSRTNSPSSNPMFQSQDVRNTAQISVPRRENTHQVSPNIQQETQVKIEEVMRDSDSKKSNSVKTSCAGVQKQGIHVKFSEHFKEEKEKFASKRKSDLTNAIMKKYSHSENLFKGTDTKSWAFHLKIINEMVKTYEVSDPNVMLQLVQWTLGTGPKMIWDTYTTKTDASWKGFAMHMEETYNSKVNHARTRDALQSTSLAIELSKTVDGDPSTKRSRAVTRTVDTILRLSKDLPENERSDLSLLQYLRSAFKGVEFAKSALLNSIQEKDATFANLSTLVLHAAQIEDNYSSQSKFSNVYNVNGSTTYYDCKTESDDEIDVFDQFFVDRRYGKITRKRSKQCGDGKRENGKRKGEVMRCFDCNSKFHLAFHKDCPEQHKRMNKSSGVLDGVRKQLSNGRKSAEILACLAMAVESSFEEANFCDSSNEEDESLKDTVPVKFSLLAQSESDDELLGKSFAESLQHWMENSVNGEKDF